MNNDKPIGVLDSGVGGLSIWQEIVDLLPRESTIYLADSFNCPYGGRTADEIYSLAHKMVSFFAQRQVKLVVIACNTIAVSCLDKLRLDFSNLPIVGTVPVVKTAVEHSKNKKIGILSTTSTAESDYQKALIEKFARGYEVINVGTDKLVPFVERGELQSRLLTDTLREILKPFKEAQIDTLVLGCSHFPFLRKPIREILGPNVLVLDSGAAIARQVKRILEAEDIKNTTGDVVCEMYTTGNKQQFNRLVQLYVHHASVIPFKLVFSAIPQMDCFKDKKVAVLGYGVEGKASVGFFVKYGAAVTVFDENRNVTKDIKIIAGEKYLENLSGFDIIVRSPGIKLNREELLTVKARGGTITSQTKLFFDLCPCPIIGVTGTKGKGTTASLIFEMLKISGKDVYLGGNIGTPPFDFLDKLTKDCWVVLELSSFQLQDITKSPRIAVMLMVTSEHLGKDTVGTQNYHEDLAEYIEAKRNIVRFQTPSDFAIVNRDYPASNESDIHTSARVFQITCERDNIEQGCFVKDNAVWLRRNGKEQKIIDTKDILLPGKHNLENVCASVMAAYIAGATKETIVEVLKTFKGLAHRLELVARIDGVRYYDDSFSTTPETAIAAIKAFKEPEILILGGSSKGSDFSDLGSVIRQATNIKGIIGIGIEWERIKEQLRINPDLIGAEFIIVEGVGNMRQIVRAAAKMAIAGDVVLLSPACASFGMFANYKERGEQFKKEVKGLGQ